MLSIIKMIVRYKPLIVLITILFVVTIQHSYCSENSSLLSLSDSTESLAKELKQKANKHYRAEEFYDAINYYEEYIQFNYQDYKTIYRLASLYYITRNYSKALQYYDSVLTHDAGNFPEAFYYSGVVSKNLEEYAKAIDFFTTFRKQFRGGKDPLVLRKQALYDIQSCEWALANKNDFSDISINHLNASINQTHVEFSPYPIDENTFIFGSIRTDYETVNAGYRQLYTANKISGEWAFSGKLDNVINGTSIHTGNAVVSFDNSRMYFTRCEKNWQEKTLCSIYLSEYIDEDWQEAVKLPYPVNDYNYTTTQPTLGKNLRTGNDILYFVSDRTGTRGGLDIWYTERNNSTGEFNDPKNLGRTINSLGNECTPYYDLLSNTLYFSSSGHFGFGGYDIFSSTGSGKRWTEIASFAKPVNSAVDDYYFVLLPNKKEGFFTSNREGSYTMSNGGCCDDIFHFEFNECVKVQVSGRVINLTNYDIYDELNERYGLDLEYPVDKLPASNIPIDIYVVDSTNKQILFTQTKTNSEGKYSINLDVNKNYQLLVKNYGNFDKKLKTSTKHINCSDSINLGITQVSVLPEITVRFNVYYEHDKDRLTTTACHTIDSLLPIFDLFPNAVIEIGSHTDNTGTDNYNIKLSQRRSESVIKYLVKKGISVDRLVAKGYGESQPIRPNNNPDGSDNPENRQMNRRTELKIIGVVNNFYFDEE